MPIAYAVSLGVGGLLMLLIVAVSRVELRKGIMSIGGGLRKLDITFSTYQVSEFTNLVPSKSMLVQIFYLQDGVCVCGIRTSCE